MKQSYRVGVIGFAHMHVNELISKFGEHSQTKWVACADTVPRRPSLTDIPGSRRANLKRALESSGIPRSYDDYREMLDSEDFDIMICCPENTRHAEVAEAVADRGIHVVLEKPIASTLPEALQIVRAIRRNNVELLVNWPTTWRPWVMKVKELIEGGEIGEVWQVKWRNGPSLGPLAFGSTHPGDTVVTAVLEEKHKAAEWWYDANEGGGALLDYCCYGASLSFWYLGQKAVAAQALKANFFNEHGSADDNAVIVVRFANALSILEGTWTTFHTGVPTGPIVYGTKGTIVVDGTLAKLYQQRGASEPTRVYEGEPFPLGHRTVAETFIRHLEKGEPLHPTLDVEVNIAAMAILDAGIRSARSGKLEIIDDIVWSDPMCRETIR